MWLEVYVEGEVTGMGMRLIRTMREWRTLCDHIDPAHAEMAWCFDNLLLRLLLAFSHMLLHRVAS